MLVDNDDAHKRRQITHDKFSRSERALMWIEREFNNLGDGFELWDFDELIRGVAAMRSEIRKRNLL